MTFGYAKTVAIDLEHKELKTKSEYDQCLISYGTEGDRKFIMKKKLCVLVPDFENDEQNNTVYWFDHPSTGVLNFDNKSVRVYGSPNSANPILRCHISKIKEIDENMTEIRMGRLCLKDEI